jgi:hypothetical protein
MSASTFGYSSNIRVGLDGRNLMSLMNLHLGSFSDETVRDGKQKHSSNCGPHSTIQRSLTILDFI